MVTGNTVFKYKTIKGPLHKVPAVVKLLMLLPLSVFCMSLPSLWLGAGIISAVAVSFVCGLSLYDQLTDFKPVFYYAILMYALSVLSNLTDNFDRTALIPRDDYLQTSLRLFLVVQISALLFRTTSPLEIREVVRLEIISLFLCFIPEIFKIWTSVNMAWKARGGKEGPAKIRTVVFVLISLCFEKAALKAKALSARS
ncbi:MAG: energy-coupling factor transporter transmembrane protein EcfT [Treponema sp.]|jgi:biotin transport system permease protein/energy-coupling factor transport system permease protein|nr:energy-coupling factor transporter transmembrane protein EcfT [Treponema sp.]